MKTYRAKLCHGINLSTKSMMEYTIENADGTGENN